MKRAGSKPFYLAPSAIHGVGVFTPIELGAGFDVTLLLSDPDEPLVVADGDIEDVFLRSFGIVTPDGTISAPQNRVRISIGWYMNHSDEPNVENDGHNRFIVVRRLVAGEELTHDYHRLGPGNDLKSRRVPTR